MTGGLTVRNLTKSMITKARNMMKNKAVPTSDCLVDTD